MRNTTVGTAFVEDIGYGGSQQWSQAAENPKWNAIRAGALRSALLMRDRRPFVVSRRLKDTQEVSAEFFGREFNVGSPGLRASGNAVDRLPEVFRFLRRHNSLEVTCFQEPLVMNDCLSKMFKFPYIIDRVNNRINGIFRKA